MIVAAAARGQVAALVDLVNEAYRVGEDGLWADDLGRTDENEIAAAVDAGDMLAAAVDGRVLGCARVRTIDPTTCEVGLIAVSPEAWGGGTGRAILAAAEERARTRGADTIKLTLLVPREGEHPFKVRLRAWYESLGYDVTGRVPVEDVLPHVAPSLAVPCDLLLFAKPLT